MKKEPRQARQRKPVKRQAKLGDSVILAELPSGLLDGLRNEDQTGIREILGKWVTLVGYRGGKAELEFTDKHGITHFIYVDPTYILQTQRR